MLAKPMFCRDIKFRVFQKLLYPCGHQVKALQRAVFGRTEESKWSITHLGVLPWYAARNISCLRKNNLRSKEREKSCARFTRTNELILKTLWLFNLRFRHRAIPFFFRLFNSHIETLARIQPNPTTQPPSRAFQIVTYRHCRSIASDDLPWGV